MKSSCCLILPLSSSSYSPFPRYIEDDVDGALGDVDAAKEFWRRHLLRNRSVIVDLFHRYVT